MYREIAPSLELRHTVCCFWRIDGDARTAPLAFLPDGSVEIVLHWGAPLARSAGWPTSKPSAWTVGQTTTATWVSPAGAYSLAGIRLRPEAAFALFGVDQRNLSARRLSLAEVSPGLAIRLERETDPDASLPEIKQTFERALASHGISSRRGVSSTLIHDIGATRGSVSLRRLVRGTRRSLRTIERHFVREVGLGPKQFSRILRCRHALSALERGKAGEILRIAVEAGYCDHSHLRKDILSITSVSARELFSASVLAMPLQVAFGPYCSA